MLSLRKAPGISGSPFLIKTIIMRKTIFLLFGLTLSMATNAENITFADPHVKAVCVEHWDTDGDGELSTDEAAAVTSLHNYFIGDEGVSSFDELQYFTGVHTLLTSEFSGCKYLTSIQLPPQLAEINSNAFRSCIRLTALDIPGSVKTINEFAFYGCFALTTVTFGEGLETIGDKAFNGCSGLLRVDLPASLTSLAVTSFQSCPAIAAITVAPGNTVYDSREDCNAVVKTANNQLVMGCQNTTFPETVTTIGPCAFFGCKKLTAITIPEGITAIGSSAFQGCTKLTSAVLPATLTSLGNSAFYGCTNLTDVRLAEGLNNIESYAFYSCRNLTHITIPSTVTLLKDFAFDECPALVEVTVGFSTPLTIGNNTFSNRRKATLYVPKGCVQAFRQAEYWRDFKSIEERQILGDVNHDGFVNIYDVTLMIDYILGLAPENFHVTEADINDDTFINIYDVTLLIDIILAKE